MKRTIDPGRNSSCPCLSGRKFKHCCYGVVDWKLVPDTDIIKHLSPRGRVLAFIDTVAGILQLDKLEQPTSTSFKKAFTASAVRDIHESILTLWPSNLDIAHALRPQKDQLSGLYVGNYDRKSINRGLLRNSLYADKMLVVDPFVHPITVNERYCPVVNPDQYRQQTLRNVNWLLDLTPWVDAGLVDIIRSPSDFDPALKRDLITRQTVKYEQVPELKEAIEADIKRIVAEDGARRLLGNVELAFPDSKLRKLFAQLPNTGGLSEEQFISHIQRLRDADPDFLEPLGPENRGQLSMMSSGAGYEEAKLIAELTGSYVTTDIRSRWTEIELDRTNLNDQSAAWSPFSKALNDASLRFLNNVEFRHAIKLRREGRLGSMRSFMNRVWRRASSTEPFSATHGTALAAELQDEIEKARAEWEQIGQELTKWTTSGLSATGLAAGPLIASGHGAFLAAATLVGLVGGGTYFAAKRAAARRLPPAFFIDLDK